METELALAITADPLEGQVPLTVWFTGTATGLAADIWEWTIDGVAADADGPDITHTFLTPGTHTVTLTATNTTLPLANTTSIEIVAEEEKEPMMTAARITHPHIWNVSKIEGEDNVTSLWDLRNKVRKGDTIRIWGVEGHTYKSGITIDKPDVTVKQWEGSPAQPIITYKETDRPVFTVTADNATFRGLNISSSNWLDCNGAGIQATGSMMSNLQRLTIADCTFAENRATKSGGGAYIERCTGATITNCTFTGNRATKSGGGADFQWCTGATITNCTFTGNRANINGGGADFQWCIGAGATITNCTFTNNTVHYGEGGASYFLVCSPITITNCRFDNPDNIRASSSSAFFNTTCTRGTNIAGGPYLGGNLWLQDPAQNISEWCADADFDGICDEPLTIDGFFSGRNTDHLPLVYGGTVAVASTPTGAQIVLDGVTNGYTTDTPLYLSVGEHNVTVKLAGYVTPENKTVTVNAGEMTEVFFELKEVCGEIDVSSVPAEARIILDGVDTGRLTNAILKDIPTGEHNVTVKLAGYFTPENKTVNVYADETTEVFFELERECGILNVSSVPERAQIVLDGVDKGETNAVLENIPTGTHNVTVTLKDYVTQINDTVTVEVGKTTEVTFALERECGVLNVSSVPEGAQIFLDGKETEWLTNTTLEDIPTGEHNVTVRLEGYVTPENRTVTVETGEEAKVFFELERECGVLNVSSVPEGARIFLDGVETEWLTNTTLESIPTGDHKVTVRLAGYVTPENKTVTVETGEEAKVFFELERECGVLNVSSVPEGARIFLEGKETEWLTNTTLTDIPTGEHNVTVTLDDYVKPENRTVTVNAGETTEVFFVLEALPTPIPTSSSSGSGGGHSDLSADSTGKIPAGGSGTLAFRGPAIYEIRVTVGETIQTLLVTVGRTGLPSSVGAPASMVYEYDEVTLYHTTDDAIEGALILFKIPKAWLEENSIDPADVVLCRYHDDAWQPLPTEVRDEDATFWYFSAQSPGFSVFAIGGEPAPVAVKTAEAGAQAGTTEPASPVTETPASPPAETPQPFPTMMLILCGAAVLLIAAVVLWKRR
ncbi:PEGA domain-containing protein [Methanofollis sp. UBA420]|uniref:PEGA domain-containing protein n=1 Tax=Methanofollis sp. UBA420 TaxID=1915514 RepID=UPI00316AE17C